jgi:hypothetical protein
MHGCSCVEQQAQGQALRVADTHQLAVHCVHAVQAVQSYHGTPAAGCLACVQPKSTGAVAAASTACNSPPVA